MSGDCFIIYHLLLMQIKLEFETLSLQDPSNKDGDCTEYVEASLYKYQ